jgi:muramidase (phage lysozyme)
MNPAIPLTLTAAALLLIASTRTDSGQVEAGEGGAVLDVAQLIDELETLMNRTTQAASAATSTTPESIAAANVRAFLRVIQQAEGTDRAGDPYRVVYGYGHTINDLSEHPAITGEWRGERLSNAMCANAGFGPGCISTAAGAYQIIRPTWVKVRDRLRLSSFGPNEQDAAAVELIRQRGALEDVRAGRFATAVHKCRQEWASLPGNSAKQGQRSLGQLAAWYQQNGGQRA